MRLPLYVAARDQPLQQRRHSRLHPKPGGGRRRCPGTYFAIPAALVRALRNATMLSVVRLRSDRLFLPFEGIRGTTLQSGAFSYPEVHPLVSTHGPALVHPKESRIK
jgi:hypothetical protein